ncbi:DNA-formamidopyrimidine glycosylase [Sediminibacillus albus]|uniref:Formamidopyrimidine-DNA glycosylase n=1 Tax=Sediminibacillus albus TaxID=407036 RepID=A0A1G9BUJ9_9BACI|nr:DNA-formamidopyrimidine glycosylase [Sediminibacillus albus]SDK42665.1 formamidopyrimidine-DNA glycosylase [Sediminibacillus albus]
MPELPEVETVRKTLSELVLKKKIVKVEVFWENIIKQPADVDQFKDMLIGQSINEIGRKGKFLLFGLDDYTIISHLRMEGKYGVFQEKDPVVNHTHVLFTFSDGSELRYNDVRKFGTMHVVEKGKEFSQKPLNQLGPDPFSPDFNFSVFYKKVHKSERTIKSILLDQSVIAGLGNIYVDETLFKAGIHPEKKGTELSEQEVKNIHYFAVETLEQAIAQGGTTIRSYVNSQGQIGMFQQELFVYGQEKEPCKKCGGPIIKMKVGGRGTHICLSCQK